MSPWLLHWVDQNLFNAHPITSWDLGLPRQMVTGRLPWLLESQVLERARGPEKESVSEKMRVAYDVFEILIEISEANQDLKVTINEIVKGASAMGGSTFVGAGIGGLFGPTGMIVGGAIGFLSGAAYAGTTTKNFKPLHEILAKMNQEDKDKLVEAAKRVIKRKSISLTTQIIGKYGSEFARAFLIDVYKEYSGGNVG